MQFERTIAVRGLAPRLLLLGFAILGFACVPTAARKNARLEQGFGVELVGGLQYVERGDPSDGTSAEPISTPHIEVDVEYAGVFEDGSGIALQAKLPLNIVFSSVDLYYQLPDNGTTVYKGFGVEVGALPGLYGVVTKYFDDQFYLSLTPRLLYLETGNKKALLLNPQLSIGLATSVDISGFVSYAYHTGKGFNFDVDLFFSDEDVDYRKKYWLAGVGARF